MAYVAPINTTVYMVAAYNYHTDGMSIIRPTW